MRAVTAVVLAAGLAAPAHPAEQILRLDPTATRVEFALAATLHTAEGRLPLREGEIGIDLAAGTAHGRLVFDAVRAETGNQSRDEKMHAELLESERFPEIVFLPQKLVGAFQRDAESDFTVEGVVQSHGGEFPLVVSLRVKMGNVRADATGTFTVPYVKWGLKDPSVFVLRVAKEVTVSISAAAAIEPRSRTI